MNRKLALALIVVSWSTLICSAYFALMKYEFTASTEIGKQEDWPRASELELERERLTLLFFAHPQCPCTKASLSELETLVRKHPDKLKSYVLFIEPDSVGPSWRNSDLWKKAGSIPELTILPDKNGKESALFGSASSGQTMLYDRNGRLLFCGGITMSRGQQGDNPGLKSLRELIEGSRVETSRNPVFGCSLF